jgi:hypothetical protein
VKRNFFLIDLLLLVLLAVVLVTYCFRGVTSACDSFMHLSKLEILTNNLNLHASFPHWNPYWYFGVPMLRLYSPLAYYVISFFGWVFQLSSVGMVMAWSYLAFSVSGVSTYLLAKELGLKRFGCITSSILFLTSSNLIVYWCIGSYPNVTGVAFSPLALFLFLRAMRKRDLISILVAGLAFSTVFLVYFMNAIILAIFMLAISIVMVIRDPALLFIPRGEQMPPKYTLVMPKVFGSVLLIAAATSLWWALPFLTTYMSAPAGAADSVSSTTIPLSDHLVNLLGVSRSVYSPGVGHVILALIGCMFIFVKRKTEIYALLCLLIAFIFCLSPWLHIPTGPLRWFRFLLYFSLFIALCGGIAIDMFMEFYGKTLSNSFSSKIGKFSLGKVYSLLMGMLVLLLCVYPVFGQGVVFQGVDTSAPDYVQEIESRANFGERLAIDGGYGVNIYSDIFQSGGGDTYCMLMINEFSYTFWYYVFVQKDSAYLPYFSRNYNVRWVSGDIDGLEQTDYGIAEVKDFDSSFVEAVGLNETLLLFIGEEYEYSFLFQSQAMINSQEIILVNGGESLEGYDFETMKNFDAVYLNGIMRGDSGSVEQQCSLLSEYVQWGGGVILDTGDLAHGGELKDIPDPFPVEETAIYEESLFLLAENVSTPLTASLHLSKMSDAQKSTISYGTSVREGSEVLVLDENLPVVAYWDLGAGRVLWTGLRLPYYSNYYGHSQEINEEAREVYEERALFLSEMVNFVTTKKSGQSVAQSGIEYPELERITVHVTDASSEEGIWVKMTYFQGWSVKVDDEKSSLRVFRAGPDMMLVFPDRAGSYSLMFYFEKTLDVTVGEVVSLISIIAISLFFVYRLVLHMKNRRQATNKWDKTRHTGSGNNYINSDSKLETSTKRVHGKFDAELTA